MSVSRLFLLLCVVVAVTATALAHGSDPAAAAAATATRLGFSAGAAPLVVTAANGGSLSARGCAACHADVAADWATTRHAAAWSNPVFLDGLRREPLQRCVHCHAPLVQQKLQAGPLGIARPRPPTAASLTAIATTMTTTNETSLLHEGVTCVVCHVRDGVVLVAGDVVRKDNTPMHPVRVEPALKDPALCASCHQFGFTDSGALMQDTYGEWQRFAAGGGVGTCQSCHMPGGRHLFRGAWDVELLKRSLHVDVVDEVDGDGEGSRTLVLRSVDVGHQFPTGDLFRHLTVEFRTDVSGDGSDDSDDIDGDDNDGWRDVFRIGRVFAGQGRNKRVIDNTALVPGVARRVVLPVKGPWRVRYHYAEARHERAGVVEPVVIASGG